MPTVLKSESLNLLEPSGPVQACNGIALPLQRINFSQKQQFIIQNVLMVTCFDSIESSSGLPENRSNVSKFIVHFGIPDAYIRYYSLDSGTCVMHDACTTVQTINYPTIQIMIRWICPLEGLMMIQESRNMLP